jgi:hypothetical protein
MMCMPKGTLNGATPPTIMESEPDDGCAFVLDEDSRAAAGQTYCAAPRRPGSAYCHAHHALCYLPSESLAELRKLKEIEALAEAVGGKSGRPARRPPPLFLQRMNQVSRAALRPNCSRNVLNSEEIHGDDRGNNR